MKLVSSVKPQKQRIRNQKERDMRKKFWKRILSGALALIMVITSNPADMKVLASEPAKGSQGKEEASTVGNPLRLWYKEAAPITSSDSRWWQSTALPIGNGNIGGLIFGGVSKDRIHFNEKTLWTGGPLNGTGNAGDGQPYIGGNRLTYAGDQVLEDFRQRLDDKSSNVFGLPFNEGNSILTSNFFTNRYNKGAYMDFGDINLDFARSGIQEQNVTDYSRDLNMETGISTVSYEYDGDSYKREMFVSYPDNVLVCRLTSTGSENLTFDTSLAGTMQGSKDIKVSGNLITLKGSLSDNGMLYEAQMEVVNEGGTITPGNDKISVDNADSVTLIMSAGTNYENKYPTYRGSDPSGKVEKAVKDASLKSYDQIKATHLEDYQELFSRVSLDLDAAVPQIPTDQLVMNYRNGDIDKALEVMIFQYGRYLTIAGSREGQLPTNLCGLWLLGDSGSLWQGDYHFNVNVQMNYWPVYSTNLAECGTPFTDFMESLVVPGRYAAATAFGGSVDEQAPIGEGNGFLVHTEGNPFGGSAPKGVQEYGWNPNGGTWALQNVYDYYRFTQDKSVLESTIYPMMKEEANFWAEKLWYSDTQQRLTVTPSVSAEQGPTAVGTTYDQSLVWQLFEETREAAEILGVDQDEAAIWKQKQDLLKPIMISEAGYVKEWFEETTPGKAQAGNLPEINIPNFNAGYPYEAHRHSSHLIGLYPGSLINKDNEGYLEAAKKSLEQRDFQGTGWSKAHRINLWARTLEGNNAYRLVQGMLQGGNAGILTNLLDSHGNGNGNHSDYPVFQIDGNYGITAGMTEMLLQSQLGYTQFLPALPDAWQNGSVSGLVARGNFVVDMSWSDKELDKLTVTSRMGEDFIGEYAGLSNVQVKDSSNKPVQITSLSDNKITFPTKEGETYTFLLNLDTTKLQAKITEAQALAKTMKEELLTEAKEVLLTAIETAKSVITTGAEDYTEDLKALSDAYKTANKAVDLTKILLKAQDVYGTLLVGENPWEFSQSEYEQFGAAIEESRKILKNKETNKEQFQASTVKISDFMKLEEEKSATLHPTFSPSNGQTDVNTRIEIQSPDPTLQIKYTLDGSDPTVYAHTYIEPFQIAAGEIIHLKAVLYQGKKQMGSIAEGNYRNNLSLSSVASSESSSWGNMPEFTAEAARDGKKAPQLSSIGGKNMDSRWGPKDKQESNWMIFDFEQPVTINTSIIEQYKSNSGTNHIDGFQILYSDNKEDWETAFQSSELNWNTIYKGGGYESQETKVYFPAVTAKYYKFNVTDGGNPSVWEWELYNTPQTPATDKEDLKTAIAMGQRAIDKGLADELESSVKVSFEEAFTNANTVYYDGFAQQTVVQAASERLSEKLTELKFVYGDKTSLQSAYDTAVNIDLTKFTQAQTEALRSVLDEVEALLKEDMLLAEIDRAINAIQEETNTLVEVCKKTMRQALSNADEIMLDINAGKYVDAGIKEFKAAYQLAQSTITKPAITVGELISAIEGLQRAQADLKKKADKTYLQQMITRAEQTILSQYTTESVKAMQSIKAEAVKMLGDETLSVDEQETVSKMAERLKQALDHLVKIPQPVKESVKDITLKASKTQVKKDEKVTLTVTVRNQNGVDITSNCRIDYEISGPASCDAKGILSFKGTGKVTAAAKVTFNGTVTKSSPISITVTQAKTKLSKPSIKSVTSNVSSTGSRVKITVNRKVKGADIYTVYRTVGKKTVKIGKAGKNGVVYDTKLPSGGMKAKYYVIASSKNARYEDSAKSGAKSITIPKATTKVKAARSGQNVKITFNKVKGAKGYVVYRSTKKNSGYKKIATVKKGTSYVDNKAGSKKSYYYAVVTIGSGNKYSTMKIASKLNR